MSRMQQDPPGESSQENTSVKKPEGLRGAQLSNALSDGDFQLQHSAAIPVPLGDKWLLPILCTGAPHPHGSTGFCMLPTAAADSQELVTKVPAAH